MLVQPDTKDSIMSIVKIMHYACVYVCSIYIVYVCIICMCVHARTHVCVYMYV